MCLPRKQIPLPVVLYTPGPKQPLHSSIFVIDLTCTLKFLDSTCTHRQTLQIQPEAENSISHTTVEMTIEVGDTHPTGIHSCFLCANVRTEITREFSEFRGLRYNAHSNACFYYEKSDLIKEIPVPLTYVSDWQLLILLF